MRTDQPTSVQFVRAVNCRARSISLAVFFVAMFCFAVSMIVHAQDGSQSSMPPNGQNGDPEDVIRVESDLVDLNVSVFSRKSEALVGQLTQKDFSVFEDGDQQEIAFFAAANAPFDLILLIDMSGSTSDKVKLMRKSAEAFVEHARPIDRISIITFANDVQIISKLTADREELKTAIKQIKKSFGGTRFWDSLRWVLELKPEPSDEPRRRAVVVMTDGVDNALADVPGDGSKTTFLEALEVIKGSDWIVLPIYLDTEREMVQQGRGFRDAYVTARLQLALIAAESGSIVYQARKVEDLKRVYVEVLNDLGTVYSIGYRPSNKQRDGLWRTVSVQLATRPELAVRTRRGYYAK